MHVQRLHLDDVQAEYVVVVSVMSHNNTFTTSNMGTAWRSADFCVSHLLLTMGLF